MIYIVVLYLFANAFYTGILWQDKDSDSDYRIKALTLIIGFTLGSPLFLFYIIKDDLGKWLVRSSQYKFYIAFFRKEYDSEIDTYIERGERNIKIAKSQGVANTIAWKNFEYGVSLLKKRKDKLTANKPKID